MPQIIMGDAGSILFMMDITSIMDKQRSRGKRKRIK